MSELRLVRINRVQLSGRVVQDFAVRYAPDNTPVVAFRIAFNRFVKQADGKWQEIPSFIGVLASGRLAERCAEHLRKGSAVYLEGRLQSRSYRSGGGPPRTMIEIRADQVQFLEREVAPEEGQETLGGPSRPEEGELFPDMESEEESSE